ncbi:methionine--tRNA ligase [Candidatus Woesebacteria bacterium RBG_16_34_12]|uniref:Methionine--tRNA ligase n=2 Tax=Candidatus Woeseibacteriota TaxID=1752722 RepID=A0A1F7X3Y0_9BACT|nr:MAG: methionine--tRNA ligase [Candidatus Woesebacteria bacterium RBG_13_34_9]OGM11408.1 MAG: methionine--tRNA ligase [Candidatus Woesebacteria bacterium RBG_16_34_12]
MRKKNFYITTTLPYVNDKPHIGFALEIIQADAIARYKKLTGYDVFFNFGTDEHGQKIYQKALEEKKGPQDYVDEYAKKFDGLKKALNLSYNNFIRTTDPHHIKAAQGLWKVCEKNGFIKKSIYQAKYCVGCELEKQDSELINGRCPIHPNLEIQLINEENYFFKFSQFQEKLLKLYKSDPDFVIPKHRLTEISNFIKDNPQDFSVSRLKEKMPWGVAVPGDDKQVMYVWFDALTNYISALGWPEDKEKFRQFWGTKENPNAIQVAGKDNLRQQSAMWQAMLMAADLPPSKQIIIHGFITSGGQKMSKSLGNVIDPFYYVEKYGTDALRYYLLAKISPFEDSDFTKESFEQVYQADLANGLGNLIARVAGLAKNLKLNAKSFKLGFSKEVANNIEKYNQDKALEFVWDEIKKTDVLINEKQVWNLKGKEKEKVLRDLVKRIRQIAYDLKPFLPETSEKIEKQFKGPNIKSQKPLFPRLEQ